MTTEKDVLQEAVVPQESGEEQETGMKSFLRDERGIGVIEIILILVKKPNAKHRYVLCGN